MTENTGRKDDTAKLPMHLVSPIAIERLAAVLRFGAIKYDERNWEHGLDWSRVYAAAQRHMLSWWKGDPNDNESGLSHLSHAMCCLMFLNHYEATHTGRDDRPAHMPNLGTIIPNPGIDPDSADAAVEALLPPGTPPAAKGD